MASKCHEFTNKIMGGYLQLTNSACKWELIYSYSELWYSSLNIGLCELYKPQCNSKHGGQQLKVYQCKTYKNMGYYHHLNIRRGYSKTHIVDRRGSIDTNVNLSNRQ